MSIRAYLIETKAEMRHVNWPTRRQSLVYTATVIGVSFAVALSLGLFDVIFNTLLRLSF